MPYLEIYALNQAVTLCMYFGVKNNLLQTSIADVTSDIGEINDVIFQRWVMEWDFLCGLPTLFLLLVVLSCLYTLTDAIMTMSHTQKSHFVLNIP